MDAVVRFFERPAIWIVAGILALLVILGRWVSRWSWPQKPDQQKRYQLSHSGQQAERSLRLVMTILGAGIIVLLGYSFRTGFGSASLLSASTILALAGSATVIGLFLGFLFGIPKAQTVTVVAQESPSPVESGTAATRSTSASRNTDDQRPARFNKASLLSGSAQSRVPINSTPSGMARDVGAAAAASVRVTPAVLTSREHRYTPNDNLADISDWLTKILVGVGLTQLGSIVDFGRNIAAWASPGLGNRPESGFMAVTTCLYFTILGFLLSYLWTRFYVTGVFRAADDNSLQGQFDQLGEQLSEQLSEQAIALAETDAYALDLVTRQLGSEDDATTVDQDDLTQALREASDERRIQTYYQASRIRQDNWRDDNRKWRVRETIPVWRALIAASSGDPNFRYLAELGFSLKDQPEPDYAAASEAISEAIRLRDERGMRGRWKILEFNRAVCRIQLNEPAPAIVSDLQALGADKVVGDGWDREDPIQTWLNAHPQVAQSLTRPRR